MLRSLWLDLVDAESGLNAEGKLELSGADGRRRRHRPLEREGLRLDLLHDRRRAAELRDVGEPAQ